MANSNRADSQSFFKGSPSLQQMAQDKKYSKTLRFYRGAIQDRLMIMPKDLEDYPAPVLCPFCEVPVITRSKTERSGKHIFNIGFATLATVGALTYSVASSNKDIIHECPVCDCAIAGWISQMNGGWHEVKVYRSYRTLPADGTSQSTMVIGTYTQITINGQQFLDGSFNNVNNAGGQTISTGDVNNTGPGNTSINNQSGPDRFINR